MSFDPSHREVCILCLCLKSPIFHNSAKLNSIPNSSSLIDKFWLWFRFDLREKIVAVVTDNGKDMRAAMAHSSIPGVWINCLAHSMNLIVQNGLSLWPKKKKKTTTTAMVFDFEE